MQHLDLRLWALRYPRLTIALFLLVTSLFLWGNARLMKGGILDEDVILQPDDPLLQSDYLFYDLTSIGNLDDYRFSFVSEDERAPVVDGRPETGFVSSLRAVFTLERQGENYVVKDTTYQEQGKERQARFLDFQEVAPGRYRPRQLVVTRAGGHTEVTFRHWTLTATMPTLFTPTQLETQLLKMPEP
ncbi:MAG: hypothetical protein HYZ50_23955 [Deltaproteobacteria bacterium]|nr:hypothetical protein [Deltaproteobacteria bacterium]